MLNVRLTVFKPAVVYSKEKPFRFNVNGFSVDFCWQRDERKPEGQRLAKLKSYRTRLKDL
jgi:hypothetical protein